MAKLIDDPKVAALVAKEVAKAVKAEAQRTQGAIKAARDTNREDKPQGFKTVDQVLKNLSAALKAA